MNFKKFLENLFKDDKVEEDRVLLEGLMNFMFRLQGSLRIVGDKTKFDPRILATNFGRMYVRHFDERVNEMKARKYLRTLNNEKLNQEFDWAHLVEEISQDYIDIEFPDSDHPGIIYQVNSSQYRFWIQREMGLRV